MLEVIIVSCPNCRKAVIWRESSLFRPFCSKRCQLLDLGEWATEKKCISSNSDYCCASENWTDEQSLD